MDRACRLEFTTNTLRSTGRRLRHHCARNNAWCASTAHDAERVFGTVHRRLLFRFVPEKLSCLIRIATWKTPKCFLLMNPSQFQPTHSPGGSRESRNWSYYNVAKLNINTLRSLLFFFYIQLNFFTLSRLNGLLCESENGTPIRKRGGNWKKKIGKAA